MTLTVVELLDAIRAHLADFEVPELCSVTVATSSLTPNLSVQLGGQKPAQIAAALLCWADTLTDPTADAWRVPSGDTVHLAVTGRLPGGASVRVYGGVPFREHGPGGDLTPGARMPLLLGALRPVAALGEVPA
jgi:hypothetical protein